MSVQRGANSDGTCCAKPADGSSPFYGRVSNKDRKQVTARLAAHVKARSAALASGAAPSSSSDGFVNAYDGPHICSFNGASSVAADRQGVMAMMQKRDKDRITELGSHAMVRGPPPPFPGPLTYQRALSLLCGCLVVVDKGAMGHQRQPAAGVQPLTPHPHATAHAKHAHAAHDNGGIVTNSRGVL